MSRITREEVERTARLARLRLDPPEVDAMTKHLERVLDYAALLDECDTEGVAPTAHVLPMATPVRPDEPAGELAPEVAMSIAPASVGTAFAVPAVLDTEDEG